MRRSSRAANHGNERARRVAPRALHVCPASCQQRFVRGQSRAVMVTGVVAVAQPPRPSGAVSVMA